LKHLRSFLPKLQQTGTTYINDEGKTEKTRKKTENKWFETQDSIRYFQEFSKQKIIYPNMTKYLPFYYDKDGKFVVNQKCFIITSNFQILGYLSAILNSSLFKYCFKDNFPELLGNTYELSKIFIEKIPIMKPTSKNGACLEKLVSLVQFARETSINDHVEFLEDQIDACVMECYFPEHMAERDLLFLDRLFSEIECYDPNSCETMQRDFLNHFYVNLNAPSSEIRDRLNRICTDSPDLLAVIKEGGKV
jgi:hypothetical protein